MRLDLDLASDLVSGIHLEDYKHHAAAGCSCKVNHSISNNTQLLKLPYMHLQQTSLTY